MKKLTISLLIGTMILSLCACSNNTTADNNSDQNKSTTETVQVPQETSEASAPTESVETEAPAEDYDVTIGNVNYQYKYSIAQTFVNSAITAPSSGGQGSGSYIIVGLSLIFTGMAMAFAMQYKKRRKENA